MEYLNDATALERMLIQRASAKGIPISATFELTPTCNLKCEMCYIRLSHSRMKELGGWRTIDEWKATAIELKKMGTLFILLTGGEPLLYPDFPELYKFLSNEGFIITINTNGTLITQEIAQLWKERMPRRINITLYGASNETYETLCHSKDGFQQCMNGLQLMKTYGVPVKINLSIVKENQHEYEKMIHISKDLGFPVETDSYMLCKTSNLCKPERDIMRHRLLPSEAAKYAVKQIEYEKGANFVFFAKSFSNDIESGKYTKQPPLSLDCRAADTSCKLDFRGMMFPCDALEEYEVSLKEYSLQEAWQRTREVRKKIIAHEECAGCKLRLTCSVCYGTANQEKQVNGNLNYLCEMAKEKLSILKSTLK